MAHEYYIIVCKSMVQGAFMGLGLEALKHEALCCQGSGSARVGI